MGSNVQFDFRGLPTRVNLRNSHVRSYFCLAVSGDVYTQSFTYIFMDLTLFLRKLWWINVYLSFVLYYVNFEVINMDIFGIIHTINWINSCHIELSCGGFAMQVSVHFLHLFVDFVVDFTFILVFFCPLLDSFIVPFSEDLPI